MNEVDEVEEKVHEEEHEEEKQEENEIESQEIHDENKDNERKTLIMEREEQLQQYFAETSQSSIIESEAYQNVIIDYETERKRIAEERKKLEKEQKELEEAMEILRKQQEIDIRRKKIEEEKVIIRRAYRAEHRINNPEEEPKERTPLQPMKGFLDDMANFDDDSWSDFFKQYNIAEENLHKYEPESKQNPEIENRSIKAEIELKELNLPEERPTYPRESSKHGSKSKSGCCIVM
jgi:hypothetical protein